MNITEGPQLHFKNSPTITMVIFVWKLEIIILNYLFTLER